MGKRHLVIFLIIILSSCTAKESSATVKSSVLAGTWYPSDPAKLAGQIDDLLGNADVNKRYENPLLLILPHAGYQYSGGTAAFGYKAIGNTGVSYIDPSTIIILGPSHYKAFHGCAVLTDDYYETPLGKARLDKDAALKLLSGRLFRSDASAFGREHSIEIHIPFLQRIFGDKLSSSIRIIPIIVGDLDDSEAKLIAEDICSAVNGTPLFIISSDFTHYGPNFGYMPFGNTEAGASGIKRLDSGAIDLILKKDFNGFSRYIRDTGITICGRNPIKIALSLPVSGFRSYSLHYNTSGNITGDYANSVSYAAILFCGALKSNKQKITDINLAPEDKRFLIKTAHENISSWLSKGRGVRILPGDVPKNCLQNLGVFVTLKKAGALRGCIGYVPGVKSLLDGVLDNSYNAAFNDPRFRPLRKEELRQIEIEISVLTEPVIVRSPDTIKPGTHGLLIENGMHRGLLLPQVASEYGWDRDTFLMNTCIKAGLEPDSWKDGATKIYAFRAVVFSEKDLKYIQTK